jgi:hypothetical protein
MAIDYNDPAIIQDAKEKLAEMYAKADKNGRIAIGRGMGYDKARRNRDSARRSASRLATFRIGKGSKLDVTKYFRDIVYNDEDEPPWGGELPFLSAERGETYYITAFAAFQKSEDRYDGFDGFITPDFHVPYNEIRRLFEGINDVIRDIFNDDYTARRDERRERIPNDYKGIYAIALSEAGVREMEVTTGPITKREEGMFGVTLISSSIRFTKTKFKKDRKAIARSRSSSRDFPVRRRKEIIQYIRRAYPQRVRG